jgi:hypothetical protein
MSFAGFMGGLLRTFPVSHGEIQFDLVPVVESWEDWGVMSSKADEGALANFNGIENQDQTLPGPPRRV